MTEAIIALSVMAVVSLGSLAAAASMARRLRASDPEQGPCPYCSGEGATLTEALYEDGAAIQAYIGDDGRLYVDAVLADGVELLAPEFKATACPACGRRL